MADVFCEFCGCNTEKNGLKQCPKCGNWIPEKDRFCPMCGWNTEKEPPLPPKPEKSPWRWLLPVLGAVILLVLAVLMLKKCSGETVGETVATDYETVEVNGVSFNMVHVQGGTFTMGATPEQDSDADDHEKPTHEVTLSDYYIGETEVTQELWQAVMGKSVTQIASENDWDTFGVGANYPMYYVSWDDCQEFITELNSLTGKTFRLPTEAEWEYAARGGNWTTSCKYSGSNSKGDVAWYDGNSGIFFCGHKTHPVKTKKPNELGIYDMSGNVCEWCQDRYGDYGSGSQTNPKGPQSGDLRVSRGGAWSSFATCCRVSYRGPGFHGDYYNGLRLVLVQ